MKKPTHGGKRPRAGRPITTGSRSTPVVSFRLGTADYRALEAYAKRAKVSPNQAAKHIVCFWRTTSSGV